MLQEGKQAIEAAPEILASLRAPAVQPADLSALFYSSGTTGEPKGVMLTHGNVVFNIDGTIAQMMQRGDTPCYSTSRWHT